MDEVERAFRDAVGRVDTMTVPVAPLDPDAILARPARQRPAGSGWLAVAAAVVLVAGVGLAGWALLPRTGVPAVPAPPPATVVTADLYSGRENPEATLDAAVADDLYGMLADQERLAPLEPAEQPETGLGFRGFVVTPPEGTRPVLRILPGSVYLERDSGLELLRDPSGGFFELVASAMPADLMEQVLAGSVQIRISNTGGTRIDHVEVTFPDNQVVSYGDLEPGQASDHHVVGIAYQYALIIADAGGEQRRWQPIDFVGETPLAPGSYTYAISVDGDQIDLRCEVSESSRRPSTATSCR